MSAIKNSESVTFSMLVAQLLAQKCGTKGTSLKAFFDHTGISQPTWSRIMRGQTKMSLEDLRSGCNYLGVSMSELTDQAEAIAVNLPNEQVQVIQPLGTKPESKAGDIGKIILASAALAFLISRIIK